jgi:hypothetical protein
MTTRLVVLASAIVGTSLGAQRPDFSGTWVAADSAGARPSVAATGDASFRMGTMGSGWGSPLTITQRADSLIVQYQVFSTYDLQPPLRLAYALDGSTTSNAVMIGHSEEVQRGSVVWQGNTLIVTTVHPLPALGAQTPRTVEVRQALSLESPTSLIVETTRPGILGGASSTTKATFTKR